MYTKVTKSSIDELGVCGKQNHIQQINNPHIQHRKKLPHHMQEFTTSPHLKTCTLSSQRKENY